MIVVLKHGADQSAIDAVVERIEELGLTPHVSKGQFRTIIGAIGEEKPENLQLLEEITGVERVVPIMKPYKLASRDFHPDDSVYKLGHLTIGESTFTVIGGPCAVESREMLFETARQVKAAGGHILRGGAFKPRTSPYAFQGLREEGLKMLREAGDMFDLPVITEVMDPRQVELVARYADILQVGARNMQNYDLLLEVGRSGKPAFLKRGLAAPIREWLMSAEYILSRGNQQVILCERGIRTFSDETRFTLDLSAVPVVKENSHLPVFVDPSHASGRRDIVPALIYAAVAAGADGVIVEVHCHPDQAKCDGPQSLLPESFAEVMQRASAIVRTMGKRLAHEA